MMNHSRQTLPAAYDMNMQVMNLLPTNASGVDNGTKAVRAALLPRQPGYQYHHLAQQTAVLIFDFVK
jgi:hypothetical protein